MVVGLKRAIKEAVSEVTVQATIEAVKLKDAADNIINPATEDSLSAIKDKVTQMSFTDSKLNVFLFGRDENGVIRELKTSPEGYLLSLIKNAELLVALSAEEDSVLAYGKDDTGVVRPILTDSSGRPKVLVDNVVDVTGTVSVDNFPTDYPDSGTHSRLDTFLNLLKPKSVRDSISAADNTAGLSVVLDTEGRKILEVCVEASGPCTVKVYGSSDQTKWWLTDSWQLTEAGQKCAGYYNAWRYVKVEVPETGIDITIEASASSP